MKRKEDMPYMYDFCPHHPTYDVQLSFPLGRTKNCCIKKERDSQQSKREEKKGRIKQEKNTSACSGSVSGLFLSSSHKGILLGEIFAFNCIGTEIFCCIYLINLCYYTSVQTYSVVSVFITSNLDLLSICFNEPHYL